MSGQWSQPPHFLTYEQEEGVHKAITNRIYHIKSHMCIITDRLAPASQTYAYCNSCLGFMTSALKLINDTSPNICKNRHAAIVIYNYMLTMQEYLVLIESEFARAESHAPEAAADDVHRIILSLLNSEEQKRIIGQELDCVATIVRETISMMKQDKNECGGSQQSGGSGGRSGPEEDKKE